LVPRKKEVVDARPKRWAPVAKWQIADLAAKGRLPMTDKLAISRT
jgi:hypothetical protein